MFDTTNYIRRQAAWKVVIGLAALTWSLGARTANVGPPDEPRSLYLNVEKGSNLITGLTQRNFRLHLDGKPHPFRLEKPEDPASVALLVEHSGSSGYFADHLNAALQGFLNTHSKAIGTLWRRSHMGSRSAMTLRSRSARSLQPIHNWVRPLGEKSTPMTRSTNCWTRWAGFPDGGF